MRSQQPTPSVRVPPHSRHIRLGFLSGPLTTSRLAVTVLLVLWPLVPFAASASTELVKDLASGAGTDSSSPTPAPLLGAIDDSEPFYFWAEDETHGRELWASDGTEAGTRRVEDLCPGPCDANGNFGFGTEVQRTTLPGSPLLVIAEDGATGYQLWRIDEANGLNPAEVRRLTSVCTTGTPCTQQIGFTGFTLDDGRVVFWVRIGIADSQAWVSDGTADGTGPLWEDDPTWRNPYQFDVVGDDVFFAANTAAGREIYRTDGSGATPTLAVDACLDASAEFRAQSRAGDHFVFERHCGEPGLQAQFWTTQGTPGTTAPLAPDCFGSCGTVFFRTAESGDRFYFGSDTNLWSTDGTPEGTRLAADLPGELRSNLYPVAGGVAFFVGPADFSSDPALLWVDGSFAPSDSPRQLGVSGWYHTAAVGDERILFANPSGFGPEGFVTDGTVEGTRPVELGAASATHPGADGDRFFFRGRTQETGYELWTIAPGADFAEPVIDIAGAVAGSRVRRLTDRGPELLFTAFGGRYVASEIWSTDGTTDGTQRISASDPSGEIASIRDWSLELHVFDGPGGADDVAFFGAAGAGLGLEPWIYDGTDGARLLAGLGQDAPSELPPDSFPRDPVRLGDRIYFLADQGYGQKIWSTDFTTGDLTPDDTELLIDLDPDWLNSRFGCGVCSPPEPYPSLFGPIYPRGLTGLGDTMVFAARTEEHGGELWRSDGTAEGTELLVDLLPGDDGGEPTNFRRIGPWVYFLARGIDHGTLDYDYQRTIDVWRTDGTAEGTSRLLRLPTAWGGVSDEYESIRQVAIGSTMALALSAVQSPYAPRPASLWFFDVAGGVSEIQLPRGATDLVAAGPRLYFVSGDAEEGTELWHSDGTVAGTQRFSVRPGPLGSFPRSLALRDTDDERALYFGAVGDTGAVRRGHELWKLPLDDAYLPAGPARLVADVRPGPDSSSPDQLAFGLEDGRLFFETDDGVHGRELWQHEPDGALCQSDLHTACVADRFRLSVTFRDAPGAPSRQANAVPPSTAPDTDDTVFFTFFSDENLELAIKVLDGRGINDHHWLFYGALSDVAYTITAEDLVAGTVQVYENPPGTFCGDADVSAFPDTAFPDPAFPEPSNASPSIAAGSSKADVPWIPSPPGERARVRGSAATEQPPGACRDLPGILCFYDRFEVSATWATDDDAGQATPIPFSTETGLFWFFGGNNVELAVKILDGTPINGKHWVFYGALSDVEYEIDVFDTVTGTTKTYRNEKGNLCGGADVDAF